MNECAAQHPDKMCGRGSGLRAPKLQAVLQANMDDRFAAMLDAAIARSNAARAEPRLIESSQQKV
jgi:hypothetical protein